MKYHHTQKRPIVTVLCAALAISCLVSCGNNKTEPPTNAVSDSQLTENVENTENNPFDDINGENSDTHIYKAYSEDFIADAEIILPGREQADLLTAQRYRFNKDKVVSLFFGDNAPTVTEYPDGHTYFEADDGSWAYLDTSYLHYATNHRYEVQLPFESFSSDEEFFTLVPRYSEIYQKESLDFMSPDEAIKKVKGFLSLFNIKVSDNVEIHAIDCDTMQEYQDYIREHDPDSAKQYRLKEQLTKDDEFYYLCFAAEQNDIPVTRYSDFKEQTQFFGSNIKVCLSKDGIFEFETAQLYTAESVSRSADNLLTAEEALDKSFAHFGTDSAIPKAKVEQMRFEYIIELNDSDYETVTLRPVWSLVVYQEYDDATKKELSQKAKAKAEQGGSTIDKGKYNILSDSFMHHVWMIDAETGEILFITH